MATPLKRKAADIATSTAKKPKANASITSFFSSPAGPAKPETAEASTVSSKTSSSPATAVDEGSHKSTASTSNPSTATATAPIFNAPSAGASSTAGAPAPKFDKEKWIEKLTPEQKDLLALEIQSLDESWLAQLKDEVVSRDFLELKRFLKSEHEAGKKIFPPAADVYSWYVSDSCGRRVKH